MDKNICENKTSTVVFTGSSQPGTEYFWDFGIGTAASGSGPGPYEVRWDNGGYYPITLRIRENGCFSGPIAKYVDVESMLSAPDIRCESTDSTVTFVWDPIAGAAAYRIKKGNSFMEQTDTFYTVYNMPQNFNRELQVATYAGPSSQCQPIYTSKICSTTCSVIPYDLLSGGTLCQDDPPINLPVASSYGPGCKWTGPGIYPNCKFYPQTSPPGQYTLHWLGNRLGCAYGDTATFTILPSPEYSVAVESPIWQDGSEGFIDVTIAGDEPVFLFWSGGILEEDLHAVPGIHCITVWDKTFGCSASSCHTIEEGIFRTAPFVVIGENESRQLEIMPDHGANFSWSPASGLSCTDCPNPTASPSETTSYTVTATLPDGRSGSTNVNVIVMPQSLQPSVSMNSNEEWKKAIQELKGLDKFRDISASEILTILKNSIAFYEENDIRIFPNPFLDVVTIENYNKPILSIEIFDPAGRVVYKKHFELRKISLPLEYLETGSYFIRVKTEDDIFIKKLLKL